MEDREIIALYWARSEEAIAETALKYGAYCKTISYGVLRDLQDAEECVSDTWFRAWNAMPPQRPKHLAAFLGKITRNLSLDRYRKKNALFRGAGQVTLAVEELMWCVPDTDPIAALTEESALTDALNRFLFDLPREKRQVFLLRYWYFRSVQEIMDQLHMSKSKVTSMLHRTRKELKTFLEQEGIHL